MTTLSQEEKEQVAVLLGWKRVADRQFDDEATWFNGDGDLCWTEFPHVTLEACMEYAKGKGWIFHLNYDVGMEWYSVGIRLTDFAPPDFGRDPDPNVAFVRALLKAEEAAK